MTKQQKAKEVVAILKALYPDAQCALHYDGQDWKLLVLGILSAQCTDRRVNEVAVSLFARYPTVSDYAHADLLELAQILRPCGLFQTKAKNTRQACAMLCERHGGRVPSDMEALLALPGVGRKIANLLRADLFSLPAIVADTHCIRIAERLGFTPKGCQSPVQTEKALCALIAPEEQGAFCHRIVTFGRDLCTARTPQCTACPLLSLCKNPLKKK